LFVIVPPPVACQIDTSRPTPLDPEGKKRIAKPA
jgi:hypothetical protein